MLKSVVDFRSKQTEFVAYIKDPDNNPVPEGIKNERMAMYRELVFNNIEGFLAGNFPVLKKITVESAWLALTQDFFLKHPNQSPYFSEIPEEFLSYLQNEREPQADDPGFMLELAHYEWVEMALSIATDQLPESSVEFLANPIAHTLALSPLAWSLVYQYPVHKIAPDFQPLEAPETPTYLVVYRNAKFAVKFIETNAMTYRLLQLIEDAGEINAQSCFQTIAEESGLKLDTVVNGGSSILKNLAALGVAYQVT